MARMARDSPSPRHTDLLLGLVAASYLARSWARMESTSVPPRAQAISWAGTRYVSRRDVQKTADRVCAGDEAAQVAPQAAQKTGSTPARPASYRPLRNRVSSCATASQKQCGKNPGDTASAKQCHTFLTLPLSRDTRRNHPFVSCRPVDSASVYRQWYSGIDFVAMMPAMPALRCEAPRRLAAAREYGTLSSPSQPRTAERRVPTARAGSAK